MFTFLSLTIALSYISRSKLLISSFYNNFNLFFEKIFNPTRLTKSLHFTVWYVTWVFVWKIDIIWVLVYFSSSLPGDLVCVVEAKFSLCVCSEENLLLFLSFFKLYLLKMKKKFLLQSTTYTIHDFKALIRKMYVVLYTVYIRTRVYAHIHIRPVTIYQSD